DSNLPGQCKSDASSSSVIPSEVEGSRNDTLKLLQRDPSTHARDDRVQASERNPLRVQKSFDAAAYFPHRRARKIPPVCGVAPNSIVWALPQSRARANLRGRGPP